MESTASDAFARALDAVFNRWSLLNLAVEHSFAGKDSEAKAEWFYDCVLNYFVTTSMCGGWVGRKPMRFALSACI